MKQLCALALLSLSVLQAQQNGSPGFQDLSSRAAAARDANDSSHAIDLYKQALASNAKWAEGWWFLGTLLYDSDRYLEGQDALGHLLALQPNAAPALQMLGLCEFETGDYTPALAHIQQGLASSTPSPQMEAVVRFHEAMLLTRTGQFDKALTAYLWFVRKGVQNAELITALGLASLRTPLLPKEVPSDQHNFFDEGGKAAYLSIAGDLSGARLALTDLLNQYPQAHYVHYLYGCFLLASEPATAIQELHRELELNPGAGAANAMLAWTLLQRGDTSEALPYAKAAAQNEAQASLAQYVFGRALLEQGEVQDAIPHLQSAEHIDPSNLDTHVLLATAYARVGNPADARRERLQSLALWEGKTSVANP